MDTILVVIGGVFLLMFVWLILNKNRIPPDGPNHENSAYDGKVFDRDARQGYIDENETDSDIGDGID